MSEEMEMEIDMNTPLRIPTPISRVPSPLSPIINYKNSIPFFGSFISQCTVNKNPVYYNFMISQQSFSFYEAENRFIELFFKSLNGNVSECDICKEIEIDLDFVYHCKGSYHKSCLRKWLRTKAVCPHCKIDCDDF